MPKFDEDDMWCREAAVRTIDALVTANLVSEEDRDEAVSAAHSQIGEHLRGKRPASTDQTPN